MVRRKSYYTPRSAASAHSMSSRTIRFPVSADVRGMPGILADVLLELTTELSIKILGKGVVSEESNRRIHPCQRPRAGKIARASEQLRWHRRRGGVEYFRLVSVLLFREHAAFHL